LMMETDKKVLSALFGKAHMPVINLSQREIAVKARQLAGKLSISGVQPKLSLALRSGELVPVQKCGRYILKPQTDAFYHLPENEHLCMTIASRIGIHTPPNMLLSLTDKSLAYLVKRFDRLPHDKKLACEDMAQIIGQDKYRGSYESMGKVIRQFCTFPKLELQYFFERVTLCYILGNGDAHLKNFSLLTRERKVCLSPCYDMVSSRLAIPEEEEEMALTVNGRKNRIERNDLFSFGKTLGLAPSFVNDWLGKLSLRQPLYRESIDESALPQGQKANLQQIIAARLSRLS